MRISPFIPDADPVIRQILDVGVARQKPQQFVDDRFKVNFLGGEQRKTGIEVKPQLRAEDAQRAGAGAVILVRTVA